MIVGDHAITIHPGEKFGAGADSLLVRVCALPNVGISAPQTLRGMSQTATLAPLLKGGSDELKWGYHKG